MFCSRQIYTFLIESIPNCFSRREENRLREQKDRSNHQEVVYEFVLPLISGTLKNTYEEVPFLAKLSLEAYNFTKNELLCRHFSDNFN